LTTLLINIFEDQLSFSVNQLGSSTDQSSGNYKVHQSWSAVKDVSSALVVLIMLVMVFSQAVSIGPFDAYTIRKLLPRLIAAVILMQTSWPLFSYALILVNDLARGIADIMYFPFNGAGNMDLWHLLANAKLSNGLLAAMDWGALLVFVVLGVAFLFTMLGMALTAIIALCFAVITLVFRKILIITLLIFAPIALLAWILPGTKKYWEMWWSNFIKALMMFPIIVAIIAAGRIFAYIVGTQDNSQFLNLIFIMIGFFGPLFLLPKTFRWGGQAMQMAGNGIMKASTKVSERPRKFMDKRQEGWSQLRRNKSASRIGSYLSDRNQGKSIGAGRRAGLLLRGDLFRAGILDPTLGIPMKVPTIKNGKLATKRVGNERRKSQEADFINAKEEISSQEAGKFGRMIDAETRGFGNDKKKIVDYLNRRLKNTEAETDGTLRYVLVDRLARFKESERMHELLDAGSPSRMPDADSIAAGMYDTLKALDPSLVQGNYEVADEVLAGMTGNAWVRFAQLDPTGAQAAYERIVNNPGLRARLDYGAAGKLAAQGINIPAGAPGATAAQGAQATGGNIAVQSVVGQAQAPTSGTAAQTTPQTQTQDGGAQVVAGGVLNVQHPGGQSAPVWRQGAGGTQRVSETGLDIPDANGWTPREDAIEENNLRDEYREYQRRLNAGQLLSPAEQDRYDRIRNSQPNW
jgi:hypothetical protein